MRRAPPAAFARPARARAAHVRLERLTSAPRGASPALTLTLARGRRSVGLRCRTPTDPSAANVRSHSAFLASNARLVTAELMRGARCVRSAAAFACDCFDPVAVHCCKPATARTRWVIRRCRLGRRRRGLGGVLLFLFFGRPPLVHVLVRLLLVERHDSSPTAHRCAASRIIKRSPVRVRSDGRASEWSAERTAEGLISRVTPRRSWRAAATEQAIRDARARSRAPYTCAAARSVGDAPHRDEKPMRQWCPYVRSRGAEGAPFSGR